eukprot:3879806-Amphidinium_carterae.1
MKVRRIALLAHQLSVAMADCEPQTLKVDEDAMSCLRKASNDLSNLCGSECVGGFKIATLNVGGLNNKLEGLFSLGVDCVALQETGVHHSSIPKFARSASAQNACVSFGPTPDNRLDALGKRYVQKQLGLGLLAMSSCKIAKNSKQFDCSAEDSLRLFTWIVDCGHLKIYVHAVYLHWSHVGEWDERNTRLFDLAMERVV